MFTCQTATDTRFCGLQVAIMIFVGFGFLMTFLKRYSYSALGLNFFCSCVVILEALLVVGAVQQVLYWKHQIMKQYAVTIANSH